MRWTVPLRPGSALRRRPRPYGEGKPFVRAAIGLAFIAAVPCAASPSVVGAAAHPAQATPTIGAEPEATRVEVDSTVHVDLVVHDVTNLFAADVRVAFDPTLLAVIDADPRADGIQVELLDGFLRPDYILANSADNDAGLVRYAATQLNPSPPATGSGALVRITLRALGPGTSNLSIESHKLVHPSGDPIAIEVRDAVLVIGSGGPTRTPPPKATETPLPTPSPPGTDAPTTTATTEATPAAYATPAQTAIYCPFTYKYHR